MHRNAKVAKAFAMLGNKGWQPMPDKCWTALRAVVWHGEAAQELVNTLDCAAWPSQTVALAVVELRYVDEAGTVYNEAQNYIKCGHYWWRVLTPSKRARVGHESWRNKVESWLHDVVLGTPALQFGVPVEIQRTRLL